jgi:hypothetical protein
LEDFVLDGAAMPHPSTTDCATTLSGFSFRVARKAPSVDHSLMGLLKLHTTKEAKRLFKPLVDVPSFEDWLETTNYSASRKEALRKEWYLSVARDQPRPYKRKDLEVKCHVKSETYDTYKHARMILARSDWFKCAYGRYIKAMERAVYHHPSFVKHINPVDRPQYISDVLGEAGVLTNMDFSSYESSFDAELKDAVERTVYDHLTSELSDELKAEFDFLYAQTRGMCVVQNNHFRAMLREKKKSGEMDTSLSNGITTYFVSSFFASLTEQSVRLVVEGDDNLARFSREAPTAEWFARLGLTCKIEFPASVGEASFCGIVANPEIGVNITDPRKVLARFGWADAAYRGSKPHTRRVLLRVKSLSLLYQFPGCPIVQELALMGMRLTSDISLRDCFKEVMSRRGAGYRGEYMQAKILPALRKFEKGELPTVPVHAESRLLMDRVFGVTIENQLAEEIRLMEHRAGPFFSGLDFPACWRDYWDHYVVHRRGCGPSADHPVMSRVIRELGVAGCVVSRIIPKAGVRH